MKIGILGHGEVGKAIESLYAGTDHDIVIEDDPNGVAHHRMEGADYVHVCLPYYSDFVYDVSIFIEYTHPENLIIHSTVPVGTTSSVLINSDYTRNIYHAPVRGVHPNLLEGLRTFPMYVGHDSGDQDSANSVKELCSLLQSLGVATKVVDKFETSELAKLASTTYYGMCIAFHGEIKKLCDERGLDFEDVMTEWNEGYNKGYADLGMDHVVRPNLYPPSGSIGGHCIIPNAKLLGQFFDSEVIDLILKYK